MGDTYCSHNNVIWDRGGEFHRCFQCEPLTEDELSAPNERIEEVEERVDELEAVIKALAPHLRHSKESCDALPCTCGLIELLQRVRRLGARVA